MVKEHKIVREIWKNYLMSISDDVVNTNKKYTFWHFCDNEESANNLAELVRQGTKRATTGLHYFYEIEGEALPKIGDLSIIIDWQGIAQCIIETKKVILLPFNEVTEELAEIEGEGDKSLKYWREAHINSFNRDLNEHNIEFSVDMLVVFEEFEMVYK